QSVLPGSLALSLEASQLLMGIAVVVAAVFIGRNVGVLTAASFVAGAGLVWALDEIQPLTICQADTLYRPCAAAEIGWMVLPPIALLAISARIAAMHLRSRFRRPHLPAT